MLRCALACSFFVVVGSESLTEILREMVFGGESLYEGKTVPRSNVTSTVMSVDIEPVEKLIEPHVSAVDAAKHRMASLEHLPDGRTVAGPGPQQFCYVGSCCGWGHRLMRQAKTFTHIHFIQNRTMVRISHMHTYQLIHISVPTPSVIADVSIQIMEWGPCPNKQGQAGSGADRMPDFSSVMLVDSTDIVNFQVY